LCSKVTNDVWLVNLSNQVYEYVIIFEKYIASNIINSSYNI